MTSIYTQQYTDEPLTVTATGESLLIGAGGFRIAHICGLPPHVAEHTAAAFNRAMQAVPDGNGWTYTTKSGVWHIANQGKPFGFRAQNDEVTGDGDPAWMFAEGPDLVTLMDEIDAVEDENCCTECRCIVGADNLTQDESDGDVWRCADCAKTEAERQAGMAEMAADDRAHAAMEKAAGL